MLNSFILKATIFGHHKIVAPLQPKINYYFSISPGIVLSAQSMLKPIPNNILPTHHISLVIWQFRWYYNADYIGRIYQRMEAQINQNIPANIHKGKG